MLVAILSTTNGATIAAENGVNRYLSQAPHDLNNPEHRVYPYRLRGLAVTKPTNRFGVLTLLISARAGGFMYLVAIMDWFSCYI